MVARINTGKNISKALNYNEQKVKLGKAELLSASGFLKDMDKMTFYNRLWQFKRLTSLNERATTNSLHVSLNFDPSEKLDREKLIEIAGSYMSQIGFRDQPYLVYRHDDAGHPHIHIVSTNIEATGNRISMHNMGRNQSEKARKAIEIEFGLVKAEDKKNKKVSDLVPLNAYRAIYGKTETRQAISNVLGVVINQFHFTSLPELNAILRLYNVQADPGAQGSRINKHKGLTYRILDEKGNKVGVPIKASSFFMKPTLKSLESKYAQNESLRQPFKRRHAVEIEFSLAKNPRTILDFSENLSRAGIHVVLRQNTEGLVYGITYVDLKTKSVFNGSDLGKQYSAKGILERLGYGEKAGENPKLKMLFSGQLDGYKDEANIGSKTDLIDILLRPEYLAENLMPYPIKKDTKRKKKKGMSI
jgi:hypothetical protein